MPGYSLLAQGLLEIGRKLSTGAWMGSGGGGVKVARVLGGGVRRSLGLGSELTVSWERNCRGLKSRSWEKIA